MTRDISLMIKMVLIVRGFRSQLDEKLRKIGQSATRMEVLGAIVNMQGPKSQSDLAKRLRIEGATVTRMVDMLSKDGLVERTADPHDRRVNLLLVTPKGEQALEQIFGIYDAMRGHILTDLGIEDMEAMHVLLDKMMARLDSPMDPQVRIESTAPMDRLTD
ncbi:MarR family winged helix-turn-helix transcriptional regulator [Alteraurantiacibacter aestuarii]|uniref:MarR family transcriptional regulator n=1 Tax=Alteraurantiacibacter aestuarii TaxID=650004 RepID=A0A844ZI65_9SPHN|nr:MarR family transcriptional regulator [Alteraurantiacibacter aestuarii]MXO87254.1 MarR family transcriptional regulator [Alteraurantiacibacter aestuarii]